ncbi:hypothetical protein [Streptosporangium roseum]|uniref:hypothetical protein n=1 Tax=Streptosporangium roseum TaxID=2001 RepID=UPI0011D2B38C|nr:hypothetical protein [Streptosporangium roseum]
MRLLALPWLDPYWAVDPAFDAMTLDLDTGHPMARFELDVVNATLSAFVEILVKAGYTVTTRLPDHPEDHDLLVDVIAGPGPRTQSSVPPP